VVEAGSAPRRHRVTSEVGRLRGVILHRPGAALPRLTPRNHDRLLFDGIPWVNRAQDEHDEFAALLTERGVEVLYLADLVREALERPAARQEAIARVIELLRHFVTLSRRESGELEVLDGEAGA
jgi:arginine deiminase